jgi:hypothetical protein
MANVIRIDGSNFPLPGQPIPEVVSELEAVLKDARAGVIRSVALVAIHDNGRWATLCKGEDDNLKLLGALRMLERFMMDDIDPRHTCEPLK